PAHHQAGAGHDAAVVGPEDAPVHPGALAEVIGVDDQEPLGGHRRGVPLTGPVRVTARVSPTGRAPRPASPGGTRAAGASPGASPGPRPGLGPGGGGGRRPGVPASAPAGAAPAAASPSR